MQQWLQNTIETFQYGDEDTPYVTIRVLVEKLGLDWETERAVLKSADHWGYREEIVPGADGSDLVAGLPAAKVFIWLKSVDVTKVSEPLRRPLFDYQEQSRQMTRDSFLRSDLLAHARAKAPEARSPLEQRLVDAGEMLAAQGGEAADA